ncbi:MAG: hypothetical protein V4538_15320 [Bacteroidota bacterium]
MKQDIFFYMQLLLFALNIIVFIYIMLEHKVKYKFARVALLIAVSFGFFINVGKVTWFAVLFCFTPYLSLLNIKHERLDRIVKTGRDIIRGGGKHLPGMERRGETYIAKKT